MSSSSSHEFLGIGVEEVLGHIPAAVVVVEAGSRQIVYANPRARQMSAQLGRSIPPDLTEDWEIFHHGGRPYDVDEWPLVRSLTTGDEVVDEEYFNVLADGSRLFVGASSAPIFGDAGVIVGGVLVMTDLTEQNAEAERLTYLAGLLDNTEDAIVALDAEWFVTAWNTGAERMYGWTTDEVLGRHTLEVARLEMSYEERAEARRAVAEHGRWRGEVVAYRKDGTPVGTPVSIAVDGDHAYVRSFEKAFKTRRVRNNPEVEFAPSNARGRPTGPASRGRLEPVEGEQYRRAARLLAAKHPLLHGVLVPFGHRAMRSRTGRTVHFVLTPVNQPVSLPADRPAAPSAPR